MKQDTFGLVQEAVDSYEVEWLPDGRCHISILIPKKFATTWLVKLSDLRSSLDEVEALNALDDQELPSE